MRWEITHKAKGRWHQQGSPVRTGRLGRSERVLRLSTQAFGALEVPELGLHKQP